jgi:hypothetical protein
MWFAVVVDFCSSLHYCYSTLPDARKEGIEMASKTQTKKQSAKKESTNGRGGSRRIEVPANPTFGVDDKRAQYARLVVFNYGRQAKLVPASVDVNSATNAQLTKAVNALVGGNELDGKGGIELIQKLSKSGATDDNVAKRGLTTAYAQEVRPFIRRKQLSDAFGRRGKKAEAPAPAEAPATA